MTNPERLRLAAYLRVSTDRQADDGYGLDIQREAVETWAKRHGHRIVTVCTDEAVSGTVDHDDREGLTCAIEAVEHGKADGIVVPNLDRLARKLAVQEATFAHVWKLGGRVFTVDGGEVLADDPDDPWRTAMRQFHGVWAELEAAMIRKRLRDGRRAKREAGGYAEGAPPFGFRADEGALVPDPDEAAVVDRIVSMYAAESSYRQIVEALTADGVPTKRGGRWHPATVRHIVRRYAPELVTS